MLEAELLLAHALHVQKSWIFSHFNQVLQIHEFNTFLGFVKRRLAYEPISYITGIKAFYKRNFSILPFVLIPRSATETLVQEAINFAKLLSPETTLFADIGTGSGAIAISLACETGIPVFASDLCPQALALAKQNALLHQVDPLIEFQKGNLLEPLLSFFTTLEKKNLSLFSSLILCANLPYLRQKQWEETSPTIRCYEPKKALEAKQDGLEYYWQMLYFLKQYREKFPDHLIILFEIDPSQTQSLTWIVKHTFPNISVQIKKDLEGFERIFILEMKK